MRTVEEDVERVRAVTVKLSEAPPPPVEVWIVKAESRHGEEMSIYATETSARNQLLDWLDAEWSSEFDLTEETYKEWRSEIMSSVRHQIDDGQDRWYSYYSETVHP